MKFYIASKFENFRQVQTVRDALVAAGHEHTFDWTVHGLATDSQCLATLARQEMNGVGGADVVIVLLPGGFGTHVELGAANALGIPVLLVAPDHDTLAGAKPCPFYWNKNVRRFVGDSDRLPAFILDRLESMTERPAKARPKADKYGNEYDLGVFESIFRPVFGQGARS